MGLLFKNFSSFSSGFKTTLFFLFLLLTKFFTIGPLEANYLG